ncbi:hypothetical protein LWI29_033901 [Acer saccharum]|uniref:Uncharacterized protein n=1 Tax=Acer saccharum TaxID=4024 RepID=A0AA39UXY1_ACESA|nr:hypothetical protein LWI29_033901 [Acer saccharum]
MGHVITIEKHLCVFCVNGSVFSLKEDCISRTQNDASSQFSSAAPATTSLSGCYGVRTPRGHLGGNKLAIKCTRRQHLYYRKPVYSNPKTMTIHNKNTKT